MDSPQKAWQKKAAVLEKAKLTGLSKPSSIYFAWPLLFFKILICLLF